MAESSELGRVPGIVCSPEVMETVRAAVIEGFRSLPHGGLEVGGVLFGRRDSDSIHVTASRPIRCSHAYGPTFTLEERDHAELAKLLQAPSTQPDLRGLIPLGWYHSHTRSGLELSEHDIEVHNRWFPEAWQIALLLQQQGRMPARAAFYRRGAKGFLRQEPEFVIEPQKAVRAPQPTAPVTAAAPAETGPPPVGESSRPSFAQSPRHPAGPSPRWWLLFAAAWFVAAASLAYSFRGYWYPQPPPALHISVQEAGGQLYVQWNRDAPAIREAEAGSLEIQDGERTRFLELSAEALRGGTNVVIGRQSGRVRVRLQVSLPRRRLAEGYAIYEGEPLQPDPAPDLAATDAEVERLKVELSKQEQRNRDLEAAIAALRKRLPAEP